MNIINSIKNNRYMFLNMTASVVLHALIFFVASLIMYFSAATDIPRSEYVQIFTRTAEKPANTPEEEPPTTPQEQAEEKAKIPEQQVPPEPPPSGYISLNDDKIDTTGLQNIYKEPTLNVRIKYPSGWTFIDQNVKNKLDGVTFWASGGTYDPPPYIHLEVKEKYLFNASRYKYKEEMDDYTAYFNEPKEMAGQVSQEIYLLTGTEEDYSIKLIMKGKDAFDSFQPIFFGMLKTFKFGRTIF